MTTDELLNLPVSPARHTDPDTSHDAAFMNKKLKSKGRVKALLWFDHYDEKNVPLSDYDLEALTGIRQNSIGKRRTELRDYGLVEDRGYRKQSPQGASCIAWWITDKGRRWAKILKDRGEKP